MKEIVTQGRLRDVLHECNGKDCFNPKAANCLASKTAGWQTVRSFRGSGVIAGNGGLYFHKQREMYMQKKILALAVAGALAPAAAMAQSSVEIYGRANLGIDNWRATGATDATANFKSRNRIYDSGSRLGFRVNETKDWAEACAPSSSWNLA
jgi:hypothetical protein